MTPNCGRASATKRDILRHFRADFQQKHDKCDAVERQTSGLRVTFVPGEIPLLVVPVLTER